MRADLLGCGASHERSQPGGERDRRDQAKRGDRAAHHLLGDELVEAMPPSELLSATTSTISGSEDAA